MTTIDYDKALYDFDRGAVRFPITIDGKPHVGLISEEALMDVFGVAAIDPPALIDAVRENGSDIAAAIERRYRAGIVGRDGLILVTGVDFRS